MLPDLTAKQGLRFLAAPISVCAELCHSPPFSGWELPCARIAPSMALLCKLSSYLLPALPSRPCFRAAISQVVEAAPALAPIISLSVLSLSLSV